VKKVLTCYIITPMFDDFSGTEDTAPSVKDLYYKKLASLSAEARLDLCLKLCTAVRQLAIAGIRHRHPHASFQEIKEHFARATQGKASLRSKSI
jgi:hypothetical protein